MSLVRLSAAQAPSAEATQRSRAEGASHSAKRPRTDAPSVPISATNLLFERGRQLATEKLKTWGLKDIASVHLNGDLLYATMSDAQTTKLVGRFVSMGDSQYPFVQLLLTSGERQVDMPGDAVTIKLACELVAFECSGKRPTASTAGDLASLIKRKKEEQAALRNDEQAMKEEANAFKLLTRPAVAQGRVDGDAYKECTTINLHRAFNYIFKEGMLCDEVVRRPLVDTDPSIVENVGNNLKLQAVVEWIPYKGRGYQAVKLQLMHTADGQPFSVWVTGHTFYIMKKVPAYREIIDHTDFEKVPQCKTLYPSELGMSCAGDQHKYAVGDPLKCQWPKPELFRPCITGPAALPVLNDNSVCDALTHRRPIDAISVSLACVCTDFLYPVLARAQGYC